MKIQQTNQLNFGMKFEFKKLQPERYKGWFVAERDFFDLTGQDVMLAMKVDDIGKPDDVFTLELGLPKTVLGYPAKVSYDMFVKISDSKGKTKTYDLSIKEDNPAKMYLGADFETGIMNCPANNENGPFARLMRFVEKIKLSNNA